MFETLIGRVQRLLMSPKTEWAAIEQEPAETQKLIVSYVMPLAAIPAVAIVIKYAVIGMNVLGVTYRLSLGAALVNGIVNFVSIIAFVFVLAFAIEALASRFGAKKDFNQALKVSAYAPTAFWIAGVFHLLPGLGSFLILAGGVYSLYLLFVGLPILLKPEAEKATQYTVVSLVAAIVAWVVLALLISLVTPSAKLSDVRLGSAARKLDERAAAIEKAAESGDVTAVLGALGGADGETKIVESEALRALAPERAAGLPRQSVEVQSMSAPVSAVVMTALYREGGRRVRLKITNSSMVSAMMGVTGLTGAEYDRRTDDGYERMTRRGDSIIIEEWSKSSKRAHYGRSFGNAFLVEAEARGLDMKDVKKVVNAIKDRDLERLPAGK